MVTWYLTNNSVSIGSDLATTDPGAEAYRSPVTGWIVSTGATNHSPWANDVEQAAATFADTTHPDGTLDTTNGDFWVSPTALNGSFAAGSWSVHLGVRANTNGGTQDGRLRCRLFRGPNQNGTGATEITAAQQQGGLVTDLTATATQVSTATFDPGAITVTNEYIFVQVAWERTGAGGMTTSDVNARVGGASSCRVVTTAFTPAATQKALDAISTFSPDLTRVVTYKRALDVASTFTPVLARLRNVTLAVTSTFGVALERRALFRVALAVASTFTATLERKFFLTLAVGLVGSVALTKTFAITLTVAGTWTAAVGVVYIARRTLAAASTFTAGLSSVTIPGGGPGGPVSRWLRRLLLMRR